MDDNAAKKKAKYLGFKVTGTLGILLAAKTNEYINQMCPLLDDLRNGGFYVGHEVISYFFKQAGEQKYYRAKRLRKKNAEPF